MIEINLAAVNFGVGDLPAPDPDLPVGKVIQFEDPVTRLRVLVPLSPEAVQALINGLEGKPVIQTEKVVPKMAMISNGKR